ncbi:DUF2931 family protein [Hahella sp. SMD15-11]|uniref:DUF2931 family protein n=1 Tax=Thermohahella caldifontis TaxID=3142973 RepID=A0AB39UUV9_9GAMM
MYRILAILGLTLLATGCTSTREVYPEDFRNWFVNVGVPFHYRVDLGEVNTFWKDGTSASSRPIGGRSFGWVSGPQAGLLPPPVHDAVGFTYWSLAERKAYRVYFEIPDEVKEIMRHKVPSQWAPDRKGLFYRNGISFGIMPGGKYVVWVLAYNQDAIEIARGQAEFVKDTPYTTYFWESEEGEFVRKEGLHLDWDVEEWTVFNEIAFAHFLKERFNPDDPAGWPPPRLSDLPPGAWKQGDTRPWRRKPPAIRLRHEELNPR